jgi:aryl-alcohol dehydrogenase-like predicted oxidoreductase
MHARHFGRTGRDVPEIGFGAWAIGADWEAVNEADALAALDRGVSFIDTADVYGDERSEQLIAKAVRSRGGQRPMIATKIGKRLNPHVAAGYNRKNLTSFVERSLRYLETDRLDLVRLHCPPTEVFSP